MSLQDPQSAAEVLFHLQPCCDGCDGSGTVLTATGTRVACPECSGERDTAPRPVAVLARATAKEDLR